MKSRLFFLFLFILLISSFVYAEEDKSNSSDVIKDNSSINLKDLPKFDPWKDEKPLSPTWEKIINNFFGINEDAKDKTTIKDALVLFFLFLLVVVISHDLLSIILSPIISWLVGLVISMGISFLGLLIGLKFLLVSFSKFIVDLLDWDFLKTDAGIGSFTFILVFIIAFIIHEAIDYWIGPLFYRKSKVSEAEAKGMRIERRENNQAS